MLHGRRPHSAGTTVEAQDGSIFTTPDKLLSRLPPPGWHVNAYFMFTSVTLPHFAHLMEGVSQVMRILYLYTSAHEVVKGAKGISIQVSYI